MLMFFSFAFISFSIKPFKVYLSVYVSYVTHTSFALICTTFFHFPHSTDLKGAKKSSESMINVADVMLFIYRIEYIILVSYSILREGKGGARK